jgi:3-hydroxyisobutyrate dehydrogenase-like beta-hydroxyacid dehydrogenase
MAKHVGFIGVGNMGRPTASRLIDAGYSLTVCDLRPESVAALTARGMAELESYEIYAIKYADHFRLDADPIEG